MRIGDGATRGMVSATTTDPPRDELWFATGSQDLYGDDVLAIVETQSRVVAAALGNSDCVAARVVHLPPLTSAAAIRRLCLEANADDACAGVIAWMHTFSPAKLWIAGLAVLAKPLLHFHTQFNAELPWSEIDMNFMNLNQSAHGDREFGHLATRMRLRRKTVAGHWGETRTLERIGSWARAASGWRASQGLTVGRFGDNMRSVAVTEGDKVAAQVTFGFSVEGYGVGDLAETVDGVSDAYVDALVRDYEAAYELAPELRSDGARRPSLVAAARIEAGLREFLNAHGLGAFTDTFEDLHGLSQLPGIAVQRLMADGYGFGAEGDWKTAALLRIVKVMAVGLAGGTSFMEDYTYDLVSGREGVLGAHMLEICPSIASGRPSCEIHPLAIGAHDDPVRLVFDARPGPAVLAALLDLGDRFRLVINEVDVVEPEHPLPRLPVARAVWRPRPSFEVATEAWIEAGGPHHSVFTQALGVEPLLDLAAIAGIEAVLIDGSTNPSELRDKLHLGEAYWAGLGTRAR